LKGIEDRIKKHEDVSVLLTAIEYYNLKEQKKSLKKD